MKTVTTLLLLLATLSIEAAEKVTLVAPLVDAEHQTWKCGCHVGESGGKDGGVKDYFFTETVAVKPSVSALLHIGDKDVNITCLQFGKLRPKKKGKYQIQCSYDGVKVTFDLKTTSACAPHDDGCAGTTREGTLKAERGGIVETMPVVGECGC